MVHNGPQKERFRELASLFEVCPLPEVYYFNGTVELFEYHRISDIAKSANMMGDYDLPAEIESEKDPNYYPYLKPALSLHAVFDETDYTMSMSNGNPFLQPFMSWDKQWGLYSPIMYASDFWNLRKSLRPLDDGVDLTISIDVGTYSSSYF